MEDVYGLDSCWVCFALRFSIVGKGGELMTFIS